MKQLTCSSREPGIERSRSFLCLFIIFTAKKMPILSVKRIIEMPPQLMTSQALFQTFGPCFPEPLVFSRTLCLSSVSPPYYIVSLCRGFIWKSKPADAREQRYFVDLEGLFVCHHQQKGRFCWLALWRLRDDDSKSHSSSPAVFFHLWVTFFAWETKGCMRFAS